MAKPSKKVERRAYVLAIEDFDGWILVCKGERYDPDEKKWHIAWLEPFSTKKAALAFAIDNNWSKPYRALRGRLTVHL